MIQLRWLTLGAVAGALTGGILAALDAASIGWPGYAALGAVAGLALAAAWRWVAVGTGPKALLAAVILSILIRLGLGFALQRWLPVWGNPEVHHREGYFYPDGYERDFEAWGLANSGRPLVEAFTNPDKDDQYGGLLFLSASVYRYLSLDAHRPFLILILTAAASGLAVLWTWAFAGRVFGPGQALVAAWVVALYPDAVLLGATHMREPFIAAGLASALYGYSCLRERERSGVLIIALSLLGTALFSPPFAVIGMAIIGLGWIWEGRASRRFRLWGLVLVGLGLFVGVWLTARAWAAADGTGGIAGAFSWWWSGAAYEMARLQAASGWVQQVFGRTPAWAHAPLVSVYGALQPFLPAAVLDRGGVPLMRVIMTLRALGWFALLPFLLYALLRTASRGSWRSLEAYVAWVVAAITLVISYRYAGDQWDNPRYRVALMALYATLAGWSWVRARTARDPWLGRLAGLMVLETIVFGWWYAGRNYYLPRLSLWNTLGLGIVLGVAGIALAVWRDRRHQRPA